MTVTVEIPLRLVNTLNERTHWAVKAKRAKAQRDAVTLMLKAGKVFDRVPTARGSGGVWVPSHPLAVTLTRVYAGQCKAMDDDGLTAAFKHVRDVVAAYFGVDDADPRIVFRYAQVRGTANVVHIEFRVEAP